MKQLSTVYAKSMVFGATTQDLTSTVETAAAQNMLTTNKTHISDITWCSARQHNACPSEHLPARFAGLSLALLETCDQTLGDILFRVPTMITHVGHKQFVSNWTVQAINADQVLLPTREGLILVLSCLILSCLVLSCLVLAYLVLSCLVLSCLVLSCLVLACLVLSCVLAWLVSWLVLAWLVLAWLVLACLGLSWLVLACLGLSWLVFCFFVLSCRVLSCLVLPCLVLSWLVLAWLGLACLV